MQFSFCSCYLKYIYYTCTVIFWQWTWKIRSVWFSLGSWEQIQQDRFHFIENVKYFSLFFCPLQMSQVHFPLKPEYCSNIFSYIIINYRFSVYIIIVVYYIIDINVILITLHELYTHTHIYINSIHFAATRYSMVLNSSL